MPGARIAAEMERHLRRADASRIRRFLLNAAGAFGALGLCFGLAIEQAERALSATPDGWSIIDGLATAVVSERSDRRTLRLGVDGDIAAPSPSAHGLVVSGRDSVAALASDYAMADAALFPRGELRTLAPVPVDAGLDERIARVGEADEAARAGAEGARLGPDFDREFAASVGVSFLEERDRLNAPNGAEELQCLAEALYFEARGEEIEGQIAVAEVVLTRVDSAHWPDTVCGVVRQGQDRLHACQFSYNCDGQPERIENQRAYTQSERVARLMLQGAPRRLTGRATHYHADYVSPGWARTMEQTTKVGVHLFYRRLLRFSGSRG